MSIVAKMSDGRSVVIGLEAENIKRLKAGKPFVHRLGQYGLPDVDIYLVFGETKNDIVRQLKAGITDKTEVKFEGRDK